MAVGFLAGQETARVRALKRLARDRQRGGGDPPRGARCAPRGLALVALLVVGLGGASCGMDAVAIELLTHNDAAIINGSGPTNPHDGAVGALLLTTTYPNGTLSAQAFCSGTLIGTGLVLTAAHCLMPEFDATDGRVFFGDELGSPLSSYGEMMRVEATAVHPNYVPGSEVNDIGLIKLTDSPAGIAPLPPLPAADGMSSADVGRTVRLLGFGLTEDPFAGTGSFTMERKLQFSAPIILVCTGPSTCSGLPPRSFAYDHANGGPCSGDSGGPALVDRGGQEYVAGVNSTIAATLWMGTQQPDCPNAAAGVETLVDSFWPFVRTFMSQHGMSEDPCGDGLDDCDPLAACVSHLAGWTCGACPAGYIDVVGNGTACVDLNECVAGNHGCDPLAGCINTQGGYACGTCPVGYDDVAGDGSACRDIDECALGACDAAVSCTNTAGGFACGACPAGTVDANGDGTVCGAAVGDAAIDDEADDLIGTVSCSGAGTPPALAMILLGAVLLRIRRRAPRRTDPHP